VYVTDPLLLIDPFRSVNESHWKLAAQTGLVP
jgi:hypothetical protein